MKIGIITLSHFDNYGSVLQTFALQNLLKTWDHHVEIISYIPHRSLSSSSSLFSKACSLFRQKGGKGAINNIYHFLIQKIYYPKHISLQNKYFSEFRTLHLLFSPIIYYSPEDLHAAPPIYDIYIAGSDNIWGGKSDDGISQRNYPYFLDFVSSEKLRLSYAASMGNPILTNRQIPIFLKLLDNYDYISVRGQSTVKYLRGLSNKEVSSVLDPTLLLTQGQWIKEFPIIDAMTILPEYLLVYVIYPLSRNAPVYQYAKITAKKYHLNIKYIGYHHTRGLPGYSDVSVTDFLLLFKSASIIVTDSFHGMLFSIIFRKNFYVFPPRHSETRITDMLASIELSSRYIHTVKEAEPLPIEIDYTIPEQKLNELREFSMTWLNNAINSDKTSEAAS